MTPVSSLLNSSHPALDALPDGVFLLDRAARVTYCNAAAARLLSRAGAEMVGRRLDEIFPGVDAAALARGAQGGGAPLPHPWAGMKIRMAPAETGILVQLTPGHETSPGQYAGLLESVRHGIVGVDALGRIAYLNRAARGMLGVTRRDAIGADLWSVLPHDPAWLREELREAMRTGRPTHLETMRLEGAPFGGRWFDVWTHPLSDGGISILFEDVTSRIERDQDLARYAAEAEEAVQARGRFFAAASHELRTPLHAVIGYTHLLATSTFGPMPAEAERAADRANLCAEHLSTLIDDVLLLTTTEIDRLQIRPVAVQLDEFLPAVLEPLRLQAEAKGLAFELVVPPAVPPLETDRERLRQVLQAVVGNAVKFTPRGRVRVEVRARADGVDLEVGDSGPGIHPADRERIFEPFEQVGDPARTDSLSRGTGLGLTVARQLARRLRGSLVLLEGGPGATFRLRLPVSYDPR